MAKSTKSNNNLVITNLHVQMADKAVLQGINMVLRPGKAVALMGPNGSGKSTLANIIMGDPEYKVTKGTIMWKGKNILKQSIDARARMGLFLSFQYPYELPGVNMYEFLSTSFRALHGESAMKDFDNKLQQALKTLKLNENFLDRNVNVGFSGGEKKKSEMLQLVLFAPEFVILDEIDSGLDIDALKLISKNINNLKNPKRGFLIITHYQRLLKFIKPDEVHVMIDGKIVKSGGFELVKDLEKKGYDWLK